MIIFNFKRKFFLSLGFLQLKLPNSYYIIVKYYSYNVLVRLWKGPEHPVNRFRWRIMEYRGELSDEMIRKKRVTQNFYPALQNYLKEYRDKSFAKYLNP
ncbi:unnamed protein product [Dracunculus medinensis]|uniref:Uncharacterized protein n=1 Tax=Dracunculus medinensis TaxID=318479 RepID=A0A3P7QQY4_DRAME|nr:unnamed protein product [Dracunculus medinensis]